MKKVLIILLLSLAMVAAILIVVLKKNAATTGLITSIDNDTRIITILDGDQEIELNINNDTKLLDVNNQPTIFSEFNIGFKIAVKFKTEKQSMIVDTIRIVKAPNIIILTPQDKDIVKGEFAIRGLARVFENVLQIQIRDKDNDKIILKKTVMASPLDIGLFGPFELLADINFFSEAKNIEVSAFQYSAKDGTITDKVSIDLEVNIQNIN